jgi:WD40 repeat protein
MHVYHTALPFLPKDSLLYEAHSVKGPHTITVLDSTVPKPATSSLPSPYHQSRAVTMLAVSFDGTLLVAVFQDYTIQVWDTHTRTAIGSLMKGHSFSLNSVACSSGKLAYVVSASNDMTTRRWNSRTGALVGYVVGHTAPVFSVAFSPDGRRFVSGSLDRTVRLWDSATGTQIGKVLRGHTQWVRSVGFSLDGRFVISKSRAETMYWIESGDSPLSLPEDIAVPKPREELSLDQKTGWVRGYGHRKLWWMPESHRGDYVYVQDGWFVTGNKTGKVTFVDARNVMLKA